MVVWGVERPILPAAKSMPRAGEDKINLSRAAGTAHQPLVPISHRSLRAVPLGHFSRIGLDLVPAGLAPHDETERTARTALPSVIGGACRISPSRIKYGAWDRTQAAWGW